MSTTRTKTTVRLLAAALIIAMTALTVTNATANPAGAAESGDEASIEACTLWALTDRVDGAGAMYGTGGVSGCGRVAGLRANLYRDGVFVAKGRVDDCFSPCGVSTGSVSIGSGHYTWCTIIRVYIGGYEHSKTHCTVT